MGHANELRMPFGFLENNHYSFSPVLGFRKSTPLLLTLLKLNIWEIELAIPSNEPCPMRWPLSQLSSTNRMIEDWSVTV